MRGLPPHAPEGAAVAGLKLLQQGSKFSPVLRDRAGGGGLEGLRRGG